jgi:hypothetical protein
MQWRKRNWNRIRKQDFMHENVKIHFAVLVRWHDRVLPVKHQGILYCTHMWPRGMLSWGVGTCLLGFGLKAQLFLMLWFWETNFVENVLRADCFMNPLWIVDITYVEMIDDVYMWQLYVDWMVNVVDDCIYVKWWWIVVDCIYTKCW